MLNLDRKYRKMYPKAVSHLILQRICLWKAYQRGKKNESRLRFILDYWIFILDIDGLCMDLSQLIISVICIKVDVED